MNPITIKRTTLSRLNVMSIQNILCLSLKASFICTACLSFGCGKPAEPQGPAPGALQQYLDQHPELNVEDDQSIDSEDEFGDADGES